MSYDFWIAVDTGGPEPLTKDPHFSDTHPALDGAEVGGGRIGNYTSNVSPMWTRCLTEVMRGVDNAHHFAGRNDRFMIEHYGPVAIGAGGANRDRTVDTNRLCLRDLEGARCGDVVELLKLAVEWGVENIDELREMNPENGWGNAEGAVTYLWDIQRTCEAHPKAELRLSS